MDIGELLIRTKGLVNEIAYYKTQLSNMNLLENKLVKKNVFCNADHVATYGRIKEKLE